MIQLQELENLFPDRSEVRKKISDLHNLIDKLTQELELTKAKLYTGATFTSKPSDQKGRNHEFVTICSGDLDVSSLETQLKGAKRDLRHQEDLLSEINYDQRQRVIDSMLTAAGVFRAFSESVKSFQDAVDKLVDSRKK